MKTRTLTLIISALALCGCATTRLSVTTPAGLTVRASFPKNLHAERLYVRVGDNVLSADTISTDASSVISAQGQAVHDTAAPVVDAAGKALPLILTP